MWVSQSYLTNLTADGAVSAYFLFESYRNDHKRVQRRILPELAQLARAFGDDAHVYVPTDEDRGSIEKEFNEWMRLSGLQGIELPGILVLDYTMKDERSHHGRATYISFSSLLDNEGEADALLREVKEAFLRIHLQMKTKKFGFEKVLENIQLRPGFWGFGYDFKPLVRKLVRKFRPDNLNIRQVHEMILEGRSPPAAWRPLIFGLNFANKKLLSLQAIADLTALKELHLNATGVIDLAPLAHLTTLHRLSLDSTVVSNLAPLASLTSLQDLWVNGTQVSDLKPLAGLVRLQRLGLDRTGVIDLTPLARLTALQGLSLKATQVRDLTPIAALTALQGLWLNETLISDLAPLSRFTKLERLDLSGTQVSDLAPLAGLNNLKVISVENERRKVALEKTLGRSGTIVQVV